MAEHSFRNSAYDLARLRAAVPGDVVWHDTLPSTNDLALELSATDRLRLPALILAEEQTAGRGRGTNRWWSGRGAILCSLVIEPEARGLAPAQWPQTSLAVAVALCDVVDRQLSPGASGLRWPNDVYLGERKLGGILVEAPAQAVAARRRMVIGFGLNVNNSWQAAPREIAHVGTSLIDQAALGREPGGSTLSSRLFDLTALLIECLHEIDARIAQLAAGDPELPTQWQRRSLLTGREVRLACGDRQVVGRCAGVAADGALLLDTPTGRQSFHAGVIQAVGQGSP